MQRTSGFCRSSLSKATARNTYFSRRPGSAGSWFGQECGGDVPEEGHVSKFGLPEWVKSLLSLAKSWKRSRIQQPSKRLASFCDQIHPRVECKSLKKKHERS